MPRFNLGPMEIVHRFPVNSTLQRYRVLLALLLNGCHFCVKLNPVADSLRAKVMAEINFISFALQNEFCEVAGQVFVRKSRHKVLLGNIDHIEQLQ